MSVIVWIKICFRDNYNFSFCVVNSKSDFVEAGVHTTVTRVELDDGDIIWVFYVAIEDMLKLIVVLGRDINIGGMND